MTTRRTKPRRKIRPSSEAQLPLPFPTVTPEALRRGAAGARERARRRVAEQPQAD